MRRTLLLAILSGAAATCTAPPVRHASADTGNEAEIAAFLAADPRSAEVVRHFMPICREDTDECRLRIAEIGAENASRPPQRWQSWVGLAPAGEGQFYFVDRMLLFEQFPLHFGTWVQRSHHPDWANEHGFSLAYWDIDCGTGTYRVVTELTFSRDYRVTSARDGERREIQPTVDSGEATILTRLCEGRTEHPPPGYRPFDW